MATRSTIAMKTPEGKIRAIYCHWDGYPAHNGEMLRRHYTDPAKIKQLIDLGDISSLRPEIGEKHPFDRNYDEPEMDAMYEDWTTAYHRDRGEEWARVAPCTFDNIPDWVSNFDMGVEYYYLWGGDQWLVNAYEEKDASGFPIFDLVSTKITPDQLKEMGWEPESVA